jgi:hypothetical protein
METSRRRSTCVSLRAITREVLTLFASSTNHFMDLSSLHVSGTRSFTCLQADSSIYIYTKGNIKIIVLVFIDNITFVSKNDTAVDATIQELKMHFKLCDLGSMSLLLSVQVQQDLDAHSISLTQSHYMDELLQCFSIDDANSVKMPLTPGSELSQLVPTNEQQVEMHSIPYLSAVDSLQYLATMTCPDIAYAVSYLGHFNHNPHPEHWTAVNLLCYLKGTHDYKLVFFFFFF